MSSQTTLTENAPMILDTTCSFAKIWPAHSSLRMDIRKIVKPDIVASATHLPFKEATVDEIYCDPPHLIRSDGWMFDSNTKGIDIFSKARMKSGRSPTSDFWTRYGWWPKRSDWENFLIRTNVEFQRVLKPNGLLNYKITDGKKGRATKRKDLEIMDRFSVTSETITKSKSRMKSKNNVHWLTMKPKAILEAVEANP